MAIMIVPEGDDRCTSCGDLADPGYMCEACVKGLSTDSGLYSEVMYGTDPKGRRYIDKIPDDPSQN